MESLMTDSDGFVEETDIEKFWNDGFVILRNIIDPDYVLSMEDPISRVMNEDATDLSELGSLITPETTLTDKGCLLYTSPSPRDRQKSRMPSSA